MATEHDSVHEKPMNAVQPGWKGVIRLAIAGAACVVVLFALSAFREPVFAALGWIERFAPKPGLSGLALLLLSPVAFLLVLTMVEWILNGFGLSVQSGNEEKMKVGSSPES